MVRYDPADPARHPTSKAMVKARLDTFGITKWPYDAIDGHGANSKAVSAATTLAFESELRLSSSREPVSFGAPQNLATTR